MDISFTTGPLFRGVGKAVMQEKSYIVRMRASKQGTRTVLATQARLSHGDLILLNAEGSVVASFPLEDVESCEIVSDPGTAHP